MSWTLLPFKDLVDDVKEDVFWKMVQAGPMPGIIHCWKHCNFLENYLCCVMALEMLHYGLELPFVMLDDGCSSLTVQ